MTHQVTGIPASADETRMYAHRTYTNVHCIYVNPIILVRHRSSSTLRGGKKLCSLFCLPVDLSTTPGRFLETLEQAENMSRTHTASAKSGHNRAYNGTRRSKLISSKYAVTAHGDQYFSGVERAAFIWFILTLIHQL